MDKDVDHEGDGALTESATRTWHQVSELLRGQVSEATWNTWFANIRALSCSDEALTVAVPNSLAQERLLSRFALLIEDAIADSTGQPRTLMVVVATPAARVLPADLADPSVRSPAHDPTPQGTVPPPLGPNAGSDAFTGLGSRAASGRLSQGRRNGPQQDNRDIGIILNPRYTFEDFVIGASNRFAHAAAMSVAETPARSYNPLFIYGVSGLGKTHLLQAIAHYVRQNYPQSRVRYVSTETFVTEFVDAIRTNMSPSFKRRYRDDCDVLLIDDIQFMEGKEGTQEEFFHTFNYLHQSGRQVVISSDRPPKAIATLEDRLRSRFEWGLITDVQPPELETRLAILRKKADRERTRVPDDVLNFIATHVKDNIRELEGALNRVCAYAGLNRVSLDLHTAETILADLLSGKEPRPITPKIIIRATAEMFGFAIEDIIGQSRRRPLVTARQVSMYVLRELTDYSYPMIGREFGGRDHTTVIHAVEKITEQMKERRAIYDQVTELIKIIKTTA